jgi:hypothetical protein
MKRLKKETPNYFSATDLLKLFGGVDDGAAKKITKLEHLILIEQEIQLFCPNYIPASLETRFISICEVFLPFKLSVYLLILCYH